MIRYAITDRMVWPGDEAERRRALVQQAARLSAVGVDYLQIREKDMPADALAALAREVVAVARAHGAMRVLVNTDLQAARLAGADGVHLASGAPVLAEGFGVVSASVRNVEQVRAAVAGGATLLLFAPVFGKQVRGETVLPGVGLAALREAVTAAGSVPVLALGGVTEQNMHACLDAGAAGIAGIRMFL